jgi:hypothetical protein
VLLKLYTVDGSAGQKLHSAGQIDKSLEPRSIP